MISELTKEVRKMTDEQLAAVYRAVFENANGQIVLEDMRNRFFVNAPTSVFIDDLGNKIVVDNDTMRLNEGMRMAYQHVKARIDYEEPAKEDTEQPTI